MIPQAFQDAQYCLPYHHIGRSYHWPYWLEYQCYVRHALRHIRGDSVLEVGCGDGAILARLAATPLHIQGIDLSEKAIRWAQALGLPATLQDFYTIPNQSYDTVMCIDVLEHIPPADLLLFTNQLIRVAKKRVIVTVPSSRHPVPPKHYQHFTYEMLARLFPASAIVPLWPDTWRTRALLWLDRMFPHPKLTPKIEALGQRINYAKRENALHWLVICDTEIELVGPYRRRV